MDLMRALLAVNAVAAVGYAVGLLVPGLYPSPDVGPETTAWSRYLVPIYLGLGITSWIAFRRPETRVELAWVFVVVWGGLALGHVLNQFLGDEQLGPMTLGLLLFDSLMCVLFLLAIVQQRGTSSMRSSTDVGP